MIGRIIAMLIVFSAALFFTPDNVWAQRGVVEVRERMFITQLHNIHLNRRDYLGRAIRLEGIFFSWQYDGGSFNFVGRFGPSCCTIGRFGFEVVWPENQRQAFPAHDSWVEVTGILKEDGVYRFLYLDLVSLTVLERRGVEFVRQ